MGQESAVYHAIGRIVVVARAGSREGSTRRHKKTPSTWKESFQVDDAHARVNWRWAQFSLRCCLFHFARFGDLNQLTRATGLAALGLNFFDDIHSFDDTAEDNVFAV